jgi:hypothetical protein
MALDLTGYPGIPESFTLTADGQRLRCQIIWRRQKRVGIAFDRTAPAPPL